MSTPTVEAKLMTIHIMYVGREGDTGDGDYVYRCVPKITSITEKDTPITFQLGEETAKNYSISDVISSDYHDQIGKPLRGGNDRRSLTVVHKNTKKSLTSFSVVVTDTGTGTATRSGVRTINCDPQATNVPPS